MLRLRGLLPIWLTYLLSLLAVGFLGLADYYTGNELAFSIFYLLPISFAALVGGRVPGVVVSLFSAAAWLAADISFPTERLGSLIPYWNTLVRLAYFLLNTLLLTALQKAISSQEELSGRDPLTGALNRRRFMEQGERELAIVRRTGGPFTLCYIDLDNLKTVNDTLGHEAGDMVLSSLAGGVIGRIRPNDCFARLGGDEFVILLPGAAATEGAAVLNRLRREVTAEFTRQGWPSTLSMGAVTFLALPSDLESALHRADLLMYEAKRAGKNALRHELWPPEGSLEGAT